MRVRLLFFLLLAGCVLLGAGCANVLPPGGGAKDTTAPRLLAIDPADSLRNVRPGKLELRFDEYITLADAASQVQISPLLAVNPTATADLRRVRLSIPDTLLQDSTTYRISFGTAIRDLHEGNPFPAYTYTFSTGPWFDSLRLAGSVIDAATGLPDTGVVVVLHPAAPAGDTGILSRKPLYVEHVDAGGRFEFAGLPNRRFQAYVLGDKNSNLIFDGAGERIGFLETPVTPVADSPADLLFRSFVERDSTGGDTVRAGGVPDEARPSGFSYVVDADTADRRRRSVALGEPLRIRFGAPVGSVSADRVFLTADSNGTAVETPGQLQRDTADRATVLLQAPWQGDVLYTLRLLKGFAKDTAGADALPSRWVFRTKRDDDYAVLRIHLPSRFYGPGYVLQVIRDGKDTVWQRPVTDTNVALTRLQPGTFRLRVLEDRNGNGAWDPGVLVLRRQPERVFPYDRDVTLKPGWENELDFEEPPKRR